MSWFPTTWFPTGAASAATNKRQQIVDAVEASVSALLPAVTVEQYNGEDEIFNKDGVYPSVFIEYIGADFGENELVGGNFQRRTFRVGVAYAYDDYENMLADLETVEEGLPGNLGSLDRKIYLEAGEQLANVDLEYYVFLQTYIVPWDA